MLCHRCHPLSIALLPLLLPLMPIVYSSRPSAAAVAGLSFERPLRHRLLRRALQAAAAPCDLLTQSAFNALAPGAVSPPYSYTGFCSAVTSWNSANPTQQIFSTGTDEDRRHELAAFLGHTLHESGDFVYPRELSQCGTSTGDGSGNIYCQPTGYAGSGASYNDPYCDSRNLSPATVPDGCACASVSDSTVPNYLEATKLFFGRGPIQISWNYNYIDAGNALGLDLCAQPDLVATDEVAAWGTAIWFWMQNTGATGVTCHDAIVTNGDFGISLNTVNGGLECPAGASHAGSVISRLDDYCRAVVELGAGSLLSFAGCAGLETRHAECLGANTCPNCAAVGLPTTGPTVSPTDAPTTNPTTTEPSKSPTPAPTKSPAPCLFYTNGNTCVNDCSEEGWNTLYPTLVECCTNHHNYVGPGGFNDCAGITRSPTTSPTMTPSKSPSILPTKGPTSSPNTGEPSVSPTMAPTQPPAPCLYYTNGTTCVNDCGQEGWHALYPTLELCCAGQHSWAGPGGYNDCAGITPSPTDSPTATPSKSPSSSPTEAPTSSPNTGKPSTLAPSVSPAPCLFYTNGTTCVNDCGQEGWHTLYPTLEECCSGHHNYVGSGGYNDCAGITPSPTGSPTATPSKSPSSSPTEAPTSSPNTGEPSTLAPSVSPAPCLFYTNGTTCVNDCSQEGWHKLYPTLELCCGGQHNWAGPGGYHDCAGITPSPTGSPTALPSKSPSSSPTEAPTSSPNTGKPSTLAPSVAPAPCLFYTNGTTCVNDCGQEGWHPLYATLEECCVGHHNYVGSGGYNDCAGITPTPTGSPTATPSKSPSSSPTEAPTSSPYTGKPTTLAPSLSPAPCLFYTNGTTCVNDCGQEGWHTLYATLEECCAGQHNWAGPGGYNDCAGITASPTSIPTATPSKGPSSSPTEAPTSSPNTGEPSTLAPSVSPAPCSFYTNGTTCVNDCGQQGWHALYPTLEECCAGQHNWAGPGGYNDCAGITLSPTGSPTALPSKSPSISPTHQPTMSPTPPDPTSSPLLAPSRSPSPCLYYTSGSKCVNDCNEAAGSWIPPTYPTLEGCCNVHHFWMGAYQSCMGMTNAPTSNPTTTPSNSPSKPPTKTPTTSPSTPEPSASPTVAPTQSPAPCLYYTNGSACVADCNEGNWPPPLYSSLKECCEKHHFWTGAYESCMGSTNSPTKSPLPAPSSAPQPCQFYSDWSGTCINDCNEGDPPPNMHASLESCCSTHYTWVGAYEECMGITPQPSRSPTPQPVDTTLFYVDWNVVKCVQNCEVSLGVPCGGINRESYVQKHKDVQKCCQAHLNYLCPDPDVPCKACTDADISAWSTSAMTTDT